MQYFSNFINPFELDQKDQLVCLSSGAIIPDSIVDDLFNVDEKGKSCVDQFVQTRLVKNELAFHASLKRQSLKHSVTKNQ